MLKPLVFLSWLMLSALAHAFVPQSGTWVVSSELNGAPGRGLAIDVQGSTLVMQMYGYESNGNPTFYMAAGTLVNNTITTKLGRYSGGRYLGSGPRSGVENGSPGNVSMRFTSGLTGFITLPGEGEVAIKRFEFGLTKAPSDLLGLWLYIAEDGGDGTGDFVTLSRSVGNTSGGTGFVVDPARQLGCEFRAVDDGPYNMYCGTISGSTVHWIAKIKVSGNEGEGVTLDTGEAVYIRKVRDAQGRYLGLLK
ncbi:hypothetical protein KYG_15750 [Acidovorax sp. NO-1]|uniref:hypothetical protein n=1 Tax=Acidovorax sp. NO-1 TaxID=512030 RepID=UPI00023FD2E3|nr:hypothetical protein [Acidovorax sp. NO-1]EHL21892.1 hypothetical protein KYG_15750 [Acidovorax sp. NO-1]